MSWQVFCSKRRPKTWCQYVVRLIWHLSLYQIVWLIDEVNEQSHCLQRSLFDSNCDVTDWSNSVVLSLKSLHAVFSHAFLVCLWVVWTIFLILFRCRVTRRLDFTETALSSATWQSPWSRSGRRQICDVTCQLWRPHWCWQSVFYTQKICDSKRAKLIVEDVYSTSALLVNQKVSDVCDASVPKCTLSSNCLKEVLFYEAEWRPALLWRSESVICLLRGSIQLVRDRS